MLEKNELNTLESKEDKFQRFLGDMPCVVDDMKTTDGAINTGPKKSKSKQMYSPQEKEILCKAAQLAEDLREFFDKINAFLSKLKDGSQRASAQTLQSEWEKLCSDLDIAGYLETSKNVQEHFFPRISALYKNKNKEAYQGVVDTQAELKTATDRVISVMGDCNKILAEKERATPPGWNRVGGSLSQLTLRHVPGGPEFHRIQKEMEKIRELLEQTAFPPKKRGRVNEEGRGAVGGVNEALRGLEDSLPLIPGCGGVKDGPLSMKQVVELTLKGIIEELQGGNKKDGPKARKTWGVVTGSLGHLTATITEIAGGKEKACRDVSAG